jgi:hypothetical protein
MKDIKNFILEEYRKNLEIKRIEESVYLKKFIDNLSDFYKSKLHESELNVDYVLETLEPYSEELEDDVYYVHLLESAEDKKSGSSAIVDKIRAELKQVRSTLRSMREQYETLPKENKSEKIELQSKIMKGNAVKSKLQAQVKKAQNNPKAGEYAKISELINKEAEAFDIWAKLKVVELSNKPKEEPKAEEPKKAEENLKITDKEFKSVNESHSELFGEEYDLVKTLFENLLIKEASESTDDELKKKLKDARIDLVQAQIDTSKGKSTIASDKGKARLQTSIKAKETTLNKLKTNPDEVEDDIEDMIDKPKKKEEPKAGEEPKTEDPKKEEPKTEEPKKEEPKVGEEPKKEEPKTEEPKKEEPKVGEEPKKEEPKSGEEPKKEEPKVGEEPKKEEPKSGEEPKTEEPKTEEPKKEEPKIDDILKTDEPKSGEEPEETEPEETEPEETEPEETEPEETEPEETEPEETEEKSKEDKEAEIKKIEIEVQNLENELEATLQGKDEEIAATMEKTQKKVGFNPMLRNFLSKQRIQNRITYNKTVSKLFPDKEVQKELDAENIKYKEEIAKKEQELKDAEDNFNKDPKAKKGLATLAKMKEKAKEEGKDLSKLDIVKDVDKKLDTSVKKGDLKIPPVSDVTVAEPKKEESTEDYKVRIAKDKVDQMEFSLASIKNRLSQSKDDKEKEKLTQEIKNIEDNIKDAKQAIAKTNESEDYDLWSTNVILSILESKIENLNNDIND